MMSTCENSSSEITAAGCETPVSRELSFTPVIEVPSSNFVIELFFCHNCCFFAKHRVPLIQMAPKAYHSSFKVSKSLLTAHRYHLMTIH